VKSTFKDFAKGVHAVHTLYLESDSKTDSNMTQILSITVFYKFIPP